MGQRRKVILVTDGDIYAAKTIELAAKNVEGDVFPAQKEIQANEQDLNLCR